MSTRFESVGDYAVTGNALNQLAKISELLNAPTPLTWDQRRDAANMIGLILMGAQKL